MKRLLLAILLPFLLSGCISVGAEFSALPLASFEPEVTTMQQVRDALGDPWRTGLENGQVTWTYGEYRYGVFGEALARDLVLRFDAEGTLSSYTYNTTEDR